MAKKKEKKNLIKLNIGCGAYLKAGFINVDKAFDFQDVVEYQRRRKEQGKLNYEMIEKGSEFIRADVLNLPFTDDFADYVLCADMIEHLKMRDVQKALTELYRVLKPGGKLTIMTTDFDDLMQMWSEMKKKPFDLDEYFNIAEIIYGNQVGYGDEEVHKVPFNPDYLNFKLQEAGILKYEMISCPRGTPHPKIDGYPEWVNNKNVVCRSTALIVNATK